MKRFAIVALISFAATSAFAADMAVKAPPAAPTPVTNWTGFYLGVNGGGARGRSSQTDLFGVTSGVYKQNGGLVGVTYGGGNWQTGRFVIGFEGDYDFADLNGSLTSPVLCSLNGGVTCFTNVKSLATDRVRAGVDVNGWLLFATAGAAFGRVNAGQNPCGPDPFGGVSCGEKTRSGWVAGAGVEKTFAPHWSAKIEYLHFDLGTDRQYVSATAGGAVANAVSVWERGDMVRAGINYNFDLALNRH